MYKNKCDGTLSNVLSKQFIGDTTAEFPFTLHIIYLKCTQLLVAVVYVVLLLTCYSR